MRIPIERLLKTWATQKRMFDGMFTKDHANRMATTFQANQQQSQVSVFKASLKFLRDQRDIRKDEDWRQKMKSKFESPEMPANMIAVLESTISKAHKKSKSPNWLKFMSKKKIQPNS
jgi:hypothetical protein